MEEGIRASPLCGDHFRIAFLAHLSYQRVLVPRCLRAPVCQTLVIFDWDDSLLCTTYLNERKAEKHTMTPATRRRMRRLAVLVRNLLEQAMAAGTTYIITNAVKGWVESSAAKYLPDALPALQRVRIISARDRYERFFPHHVCQWKMNAFLELQRHFDERSIMNLISVGDSPLELHAAQALGNKFDQARVKTVKLFEAPSPGELLRELELVAASFGEILSCARNCSLNIKERAAGSTTSSAASP